MSEVHHPRSPSRLHRLSQCPGSDYLSRGLPEEPPGPWADEGTMLHDVMAGMEHELTPEQEDLIDSINEFLEGLDLTSVENERKLSLTDSHGNELFWGYADRVAIDIRNPKIGFLMDWKFGRVSVPNPELNLQMAAYAAAWAQEKDLDMVQAYIFQPRVSWKPKVFTFTDPAGIIRTIEEINIRCDAPEKVFQAGDHCRYCPARRICPELRHESAMVLHEEHLVTLDNAAGWFDLASRVNRVSKEILDGVKAFVIQNNGAVDGLELSRTPGNREITDIEDCFNQCIGVLSPEEFREAVKIQWGALERKYAEACVAQGRVKTLKEGKERFGNIMPWTRGSERVSVKRVK